MQLIVPPHPPAGVEPGAPPYCSGGSSSALASSSSLAVRWATAPLLPSPLAGTPLPIPAGIKPRPLLPRPRLGPGREGHSFGSSSEGVRLLNPRPAVRILGERLRPLGGAAARRDPLQLGVRVRGSMALDPFPCHPLSVTSLPLPPPPPSVFPPQASSSLSRPPPSSAGEPVKRGGQGSSTAPRV